MDISVHAAGGLRERKRRQTRSAMIDAVIQLCARRRFESITIDEIAAVADVSPRTFLRYFPTKDAVVLEIIDTLAGMAAAELERLDRGIDPLTALVLANVGVIARAKNVSDVDGEPRTPPILRIFSTSPTLWRLACGFRVNAMTEALARRMGVGIDDRSLHLVVELWWAVMRTACDQLAVELTHRKVDADDVPELVMNRLQETYEMLESVLR